MREVMAKFALAYRFLFVPNIFFTKSVVFAQKPTGEGIISSV